MASSMGIINFEDVRRQITMRKREEILKKYGSSIWYSETEKCWYCHIPDETKKDGRKKVKRKKQEAIKQVVCDYWLAHEEMDKVDESEKEVSLIQERISSDREVDTVESLFYKFMEYKKNLVSTGTIRRMMADWERFYAPNPDFIHKPYCELTKIDMDNFFNMILNKHQLKKKAFYNMCGILKQMMQYAEDAEFIAKSPYRLNINKKKFVATKKKPAAQEVYQGNEKELLIQEMERRLSENPSNTATLAVILDFELGARKGEIMALRKSDINAGWIHICRQLVEEFDVSDLDNIKSKGFKVVDYTKSEDGDRWLPLTDKAIEIIHRIEEINKEYGESYGDYLFVRNGYVMSPDAIDAQILRGCEYLEIPVRTMHKIRKTYASTLLHNGASISVVKDMLGHADESTTLKHYVYNTETDENTAKIVKNALGEETISDIPVKTDYEKVTKSDQKIICFNGKKKAENPVNTRFSAS